MTAFDSTGLLLGSALGIIASALFFAGLAFGLRIALRSQIPMRILTLSAAVRIGLLLLLGWSVTTQGGPWMLLGFAGSFLIVRVIVTTVARFDAVTEDAP